MVIGCRKIVVARRPPPSMSPVSPFVQHFERFLLTYLHRAHQRTPGRVRPSLEIGRWVGLYCLYRLAAGCCHHVDLGGAESPFPKRSSRRRMFRRNVAGCSARYSSPPPPSGGQRNAGLSAQWSADAFCGQQAADLGDRTLGKRPELPPDADCVEPFIRVAGIIVVDLARSETCRTRRPARLFLGQFQL
jgi:hypothetical protein